MRSLTISNMDLGQLKQFINSNNERVILVENGKPTLVLLSFEDYRKGLNLKEVIGEEVGVIEKTGQREGVKDELTLDDLPF